VTKMYVLMEFYAVSEYSDELDACRIINIYKTKKTANKELKEFQKHADKEGQEYTYEVHEHELIEK
jgi:hypothetical protein